MQSGICLHCAAALRDAESVGQTKAEPGSQGAKQDVLENKRKGWCRTTAERRKRKIFKIFQNTMWYGKGIFYYGVAANVLDEKDIIENVCFEYVKCNVT